MAAISPTTPKTTPTSGSSTVAAPGTSLDTLSSDQYFKLVINELKNQDPLSPTDNEKLLQQISTIRSIGASDKLSTALNLVQTGQSLSTATGIIGKNVKALAADGTTVSGVVDSATLDVDPKDSEKRVFKVHIGSQSFDLKNVREITGAAAPPAGTTTTT